MGGLFHESGRNRECQIEGPAGTGKSFGIGHFLNWVAENHKGCRLLAMRRFRESLQESFCVTFETKVLTPDHGAVAGHIKNRRSYDYENGSRIILGGMGNKDQERRIFSTEYDVIYVQECTELTEEQWESLHRALRNHVVPFQMLIGDCNPASEHHWMNQRCHLGRCRRLKTTHEDNPEYFILPTSKNPNGTWTETGLKYLEGLSKHLTGVQRKRLFEGLWVTAEGAIWGNYNSSFHIIEEPRSPIKWYFASVDWGFRNPGVMGLWGVDADRRMYLLREIYHTEKNPDWWAEWAKRWDDEYNLKTIVCDPAEPDNIDLFNKRVRQEGGRRKAIGANNAFKMGTDIVRERLNEGWNNSGAGIYFMETGLEMVDERLRERHLPTRTIAEIEGYCWREVSSEGVIKEEPAPDSVDHGCDMVRYACVYLDWSQFNPSRDEQPQDVPGTLGYALEHEETWKRIKRGDYL
jgi:phage terminase large subunit